MNQGMSTPDTTLKNFGFCPLTFYGGELQKMDTGMWLHFKRIPFDNLAHRSGDRLIPLQLL